MRLDLKRPWEAIARWITRGRAIPSAPDEARQVREAIAASPQSELLRTCLTKVAIYGSLTVTQLATATGADVEVVNSVVAGAVVLRLLAATEGSAKVAYVLTPLARRQEMVFVGAGGAVEARGIIPPEHTPNRWGGAVRPPHDARGELGD